MTGSQRLTTFAALATALATSTLHTVLSSGTWLLPLMLGIVVVAVSAEAARTVGVPRPLVPLVGLLAGGLFVNIHFAHAASWFHVVPTRASVRALATLTDEGFRDIGRFAAPVTAVTGIAMLATAGVVLIAVLVDTFAVTMRRPALAGLPLLGLYAVPAAVAPDGVSWQSFVLGAAGFLALLLAEARERVSRWGRRLAGSRTRPMDSSPLAALGRRVGFAAVGLAVVVPAVLPGLGDGEFGFGTGGGLGGNGRGTSPVEVDNPILSLRDDLGARSDALVLTYTSDSPGGGSYLRLVTLDEFTGNEWGPRRLTVPKDQTVDKGMGTPTGLGADVERAPVKSRVTIAKDFDTRWLPLPYAAQRVTVDEGRWLYDVASFNVYSSDTTTRGRTYDVESILVQPNKDQLRASGQIPADLEVYLQVPADTPAVVKETAEAVTEGAQMPYDKAIALQTWLRSDTFVYSEQAPGGSGPSAIADFLARRSGFCVHYASAMAIMARQLGIPARVSTGYLPGSEDRLQPGVRQVTRKDAHAWPELYFAGVGWVPFEPTPAARTGSNLRPYQDPNDAPSGGPSEDATSDTLDPSSGSAAPANPGRRAQDRPDERNPDGSALAPPPPPSSRTPLLVLGGALVAVLLALAPRTARMTVRRRRWAAATTPLRTAEAAWAELADTAQDYGLAGPGGLTPRQYAGRLAKTGRLDDAATDALARLSQRTERARYARPAVVPAVVPAAAPVGGSSVPAGAGATAAAGLSSDAAEQDLRTARGDVAAIASALRAGASSNQRLRATWLPASTSALLHSAGERIADLLDWFDTRGDAIKRRLTLRRRPA
jgi:transglutaminase-like putative cysteine protease